MSQAQTRQPSPHSASVSNGSELPWREREFLTLQLASEIAGVSAAALYRCEAEGKLEFRRFAGRTLIPTAALIKLLNAAPAWAASDRGSEARKRRAQIAQARWQS